MWVIYKHTLLVDGLHKGWSYVGQTIQKASYRFNNGHGYTKCPTFYEAIMLYGGEAAWDTNWSHEILADNIATQKEANILEKQYIAQYHTYIYDSMCQGYNMTPGGQGQVLKIRVYNLDTGESVKICADQLEQYEALGWVFPRTKEEKNKAYNIWFKTYYKLNKEKQKLKSKRHYEKHKTEIIARTTKNNKTENARLKQKQWREANKEAIKLKSAEYYKKHREQILERTKQYQKNKKNSLQK